MTYLGAQASVFLKKASSHGNLKECICSRYLYLGGSLYIICALLNIWVLKYLDYSKMLPLTSITYIWTLILAFVIFAYSGGYPFSISGDIRSVPS